MCIDCEIMADTFEELQNLLKEEAIEDINWAFTFAFENELPFRSNFTPK